jgi:ATP diphosphatase
MNDTDRDEFDSISLMDGIPHDLAELQRAVKLQRQAACAGFDWAAPAPVLDKLQEETDELLAAMASGDAAQVEDELGDLLFVVVNLARQLKADPAAALCRANAKFERRFRALERLAGNRERLGMMALVEMEALWQQVKAAEYDAA